MKHYVTFLQESDPLRHKKSQDTPFYERVRVGGLDRSSVWHELYIPIFRQNKTPLPGSVKAGFIHIPCLFVFISFENQLFSVCSSVSASS